MVSLQALDMQDHGSLDREVAQISLESYKDKNLISSLVVSVCARCVCDCVEHTLLPTKA